MQYSRKIEREINENGVGFDIGSVYARLNKLTDIRKAKGKRYSLAMILMIILMAKLCGEDTAIQLIYLKFVAHIGGLKPVYITVGM